MATTTDKMLLQMVVDNKKAIKAINKVDTASKNIDKNSQGFFKRMKAGWLLIGGLLTGVVIGGFRKLINAASDAQETVSKFNTVFKSVAKEADNVAQNLASNFGLSGIAAKKLLSDTGDLLTGFGFTGKAALDLSKEVNELAVDLASFTNFSGGAEGASAALTKALLGERESVKSLGISILDTDVKARVLKNTQDGLTFATERQAKAYATLQIAQDQSKNAQGDFARTSKQFANQMRILSGNFENLAVSMGTKLLPLFAPFISSLNKVLTPSKDILTVTDDLIKSQKEYNEIIIKLKDSQLDLASAEGQALVIRESVLKLDILKQLKAVNDLYNEQSKNLETLNEKQKTNTGEFQLLRTLLAGTTEETIRLSTQQIRLLGITESYNTIIESSIDGTTRFVTALVNTEAAQRKLNDAEIAATESVNTFNEAKLLSTEQVDKFALALINEEISLANINSLNEILQQQILDRVEPLENEILIREKASKQKAVEEEAEKKRNTADQKRKDDAAVAGKKRADDRKKLIKDLRTFITINEKEITKMTNAEIKARTDAEKKGAKFRKQASDAFVSGFLGGIDSMKSNSKDVFISIGKSFINMIVNMITAQAALLFASLNFIAGAAALVAAGAVKAIGGTIVNEIAAAEEGMGSAPGGPVLVGEGGVEGAISPGGRRGFVGLNGAEIRNFPKGTEIIPNNKLNMARFGALPAFQNGGFVGGGDTVDSSRPIIIENQQVVTDSPEDWSQQMMEFSENTNTDIINP